MYEEKKQQLEKKINFFHENFLPKFRKLQKFAPGLKWEISYGGEVFDLSKDFSGFKNKYENDLVKSPTESRLTAIDNGISRTAFGEENPNSFNNLSLLIKREIIPKLRGLVKVKDGGQKEIELNLEEINKLSQKYNLFFVSDSLDKVLIKEFLEKEILDEILEWKPKEFPHSGAESSVVVDETQILVGYLENKRIDLDYLQILSIQLRKKL